VTALALAAEVIAVRARLKAARETAREAEEKR
jgi:hypothetical protein